jgi:signal transduction histidine kinase
LWLILLDNAVKYTEQGGRVCIAVQTSAKGGIDVTVSDTGVGIAKDDLPHVFERFWRADKVRSRAMGGSGLGLSIGKWIAERHGGRIEIHSEPDSGTEVVVHLLQISDQISASVSDPDRVFHREGD